MSFSVDSAGVAGRPRLFLIDGSSYIFRAFYAIPASTNSKGLPTNAIFGFTNLLLKFLKRYRPQYVVVALDAGRATFRRRMFPDYKANSAAAPAALVSQLPYIRRVLKGLNLALLELPDYEADDIIASLCAVLRREDCELVVVSSDKDLMQLVSDGIRLLDGASERWLGVAEVQSKFGVVPEKVTQVMGLTGDPVDNIPGVKGIGPKTAVALIEQFHTLEDLFNALDQVEALSLRGATRVRKLLERARETALLSRELATVR
ncbi:MAG TPA: 5'-3' exonuclease H3TH domain-containing protein, partial [Candidatus Binatia bacterium]|nr:5'-3' exonuclease H3TH domain-containing protein [Candidatus Binatia bacterium]